MDQFKAKFLEEAFDLIQDLEESLLILEDDPDSKSHIERVFRAMHTIKGNSAMFGYGYIDRFTHNLESVYDAVRGGRLRITSALLTVTLSAVDHLKVLLNEGDSPTSETLQESLRLTEQINAFTNVGAASSESDCSEPKTSKEEGGVSTFFIYFKPNADIFRSGTNPLYLVDDLCGLGHSLTYVSTDAIPALPEMQVDACYTSWNIFLSTAEDINALQDVFIFVDDVCEIVIEQIASVDLLVDKHFVDSVAAIHSEGRAFDIETLKAIAAGESCPTISQGSSASGKTKLVAKDNAISSIRVSSEKVDGLMNLVSELVTVQARLSLFAEQNLLPELMVISENMDKISRRLRDTAFSICLIPLDSIMTRFHRLVRDVSTELGKDVSFITEGTDTELDKTMIESLADPIMHILRNSLDHGIEPADVRAARGKASQGTIKLKAFYSGTNVHIEISDDGGGIDPDKVRNKAISAGLIPSDAVLTRQELVELIFHPGFSTAAQVTDLSGRGVGMDVVKRKVEEIRGEVELHSTVGEGTTITIKLPLTLSITDGLLVKIADTLFVVPLSVVDTIFAVKHGELKEYNNLVVLAGQQMPYVYLRSVFDYPTNEEEQEQVVVVKYLDTSVGLVVDKVIGEYQAVLKSLGRTFKNLDIVSGATILGDGTIALVLDTAKVIRQFCS